MQQVHCLITAAVLMAAAAPVLAQSAPASDVFPGRMVDGSQMQVGRYTTTLAKSAREVAHPLQVFVQISYPRQTVRTVGDAVNHTLLRTGWRLVEPSALTPEAVRFLGLPLPESQRSLGPYRARDVLQVLLGDTWVWHEDPVRRLVWFTVAPRLANLTTARTDTTQAVPVAQQITPALPETPAKAAHGAAEGTAQ